MTSTQILDYKIEHIRVDDAPDAIIVENENTVTVLETRDNWKSKDIEIIKQKNRYLSSSKS